MTKLVVLGQGYVGLPLALTAAAAGISVVGYDTNAEVVRDISAGNSRIGEQHSAELRLRLSDRSYRCTADSEDVSEFDVATICVPTPLLDGKPDLRPIAKACTEIGRHLRPNTTVILESTSFPGTTEDLVAVHLEHVSSLRAGTDFHLGFSPERVDPGNFGWTIANTPKVVSGISPCCLDAVDHFYSLFVETTVRAPTTRVAELSKLLENSYRQVNVALVNEFSGLASLMDVEMADVIAAASTKPFGFSAFYPGPGVGGHCLPVDPVYLSWAAAKQWHHSLSLLDVACRVNDRVPSEVVEQLVSALERRQRTIDSLSVVVLGLSYKPDVGDRRNSPAVRVAEELAAMGADVCCVDPWSDSWPAPEGCTYATGDYVTAAANCDLTLQLVAHSVFDQEVLHEHAVVVDLSRGLLTTARLDAALDELGGSR